MTFDTQKQNNKVWAEYRKKLATWRETHSADLSNPNGVSSTELIQQLELSSEPQASTTFSNVSNDFSGPKSTVNGHWDVLPDPSVQHTHSNYHYFETNGQKDISGDILTVTYTNLKHSYYIDKSGTKHNIAKIVRTFSNMSKRTPINTNNNMLLVVYDDPTEGFWYNSSDGVTVTDQYYDESGNPISFNGNAYLAITSLNASYANGHDWALTSNDPWHVERAELLSNGSPINLFGSTVSSHGNLLFSNDTNFFVKGVQGLPLQDTLWKNSTVSWDQKGPNQYFGAGLFSLSGSKVSIRYSINHGRNGDSGTTVWATSSTIIPVTPGPAQPKVPKTTSANFHYDTS